MAKTRRDLLIAIAKKVGGERGRRMREALEQCDFSGLLDRPITDQEFAQQLKNAERELPGVLASNADDQTPGREEPGTWGFPN